MPSVYQSRFHAKARYPVPELPNKRQVRPQLFCLFGRLQRRTKQAPMMLTNVRALPHFIAKFICYLKAQWASFQDAKLPFFHLFLEHHHIKFLGIGK